MQRILRRFVRSRTNALGLTTLLDRMDSAALAGTSVIKWSAPVPSFGDLSSSLVATVGLNPSNREFVDDSGQELCDTDRRFHTLGSLGLESLVRRGHPTSAAHTAVLLQVFSQQSL